MGRRERAKESWPTVGHGLRHDYVARRDVMPPRRDGVADFHGRGVPANLSGAISTRIWVVDR